MTPVQFHTDGVSGSERWLDHTRHQLPMTAAQTETAEPPSGRLHEQGLQHKAEVPPRATERGPVHSDSPACCATRGQEEAGQSKVRRTLLWRPPDVKLIAVFCRNSDSNGLGTEIYKSRRYHITR